MSRLDRYIRNTILMSMLVVMALIISVDAIFSLADELGSTSANYRVAHALLFVLLTIPTAVYELLPFTALGGALIGLGILASSNELVVIQASGISTGRIVWAVMKPTVGVMLLSLVLGEYVAPQLEQKAQSDRALIQSGGEAINTSHGDWRRVGNETVHINAIAPGGRRLFGVTRYLLDEEQRILRSSFAESGRFVDAAEAGQGYYWVLENVEESRITPERVATAQYAELEWHVDLTPELLAVLLVEPERQSISGLYRLASYFESEGLDARNYFLAFWKKMLQPLATAALVLLAVSSVFGPLREATMGYRVFIAIAIGLAFTLGQRLLGPASLIYGFSPMLAVLVPILLCFVAGAILLRRVQ